MLALNKKKGLHNANLIGLLDDLQDRIRNMAFTDPGLAIGSVSKKEVLVANTVVYLYDGVFCSKATAEQGFTATTDDIAANASTVQEAVFLVSLKADGTIVLTKGAVASGAGNALLPEVPSTAKCVIGHVRVAVDAGSTDFDATSDDLDAAHLTVTYTDLGYLFNRFDAAQ